MIDYDLSEARDTVMIPIRTGFMEVPKTKDVEIEFSVYADFPSN